MELAENISYRRSGSNFRQFLSVSHGIEEIDDVHNSKEESRRFTFREKKIT